MKFILSSSGAMLFQRRCNDIGQCDNWTHPELVRRDAVVSVDTEHGDWKDSALSDLGGQQQAGGGQELQLVTWEGPDAQRPI